MRQNNLLNGNIVIENFIIHYMLSFKRLCLITLYCPLLALVICFVTAYVFQSDDIHETHCRVYNVIPSISSITGISPQRYLWRISIALHIGPRFIITAVHTSYQLNLINTAAKREFQDKARWWLNLAFWLNVFEIASLCGVTYISNRENYVIHEKLFIVFMISSLLHMLSSIKGMILVARTNNNLKQIEKNLIVKKTILIISLISTVGLVVFFLKHRLLCHDMAFSWFAFCEYVIALANMAFHISVILDFPTEHLIIARGLKNAVENQAQHSKIS